MILVTGATGNIGSELVKQLISRGQKVRALVRNVEKAKALTGCDLARGDLERIASLDAAMKGAEKLFLLSVADPNQVALQSNAIQAAKRAGVKHVVRLSAAGADPSSAISVAKWHGQSDKELMASGIPFTILQPGFFMQNTLMFAGTVAKQSTVYGCTGAGKIAIIDTRDIADVAAAALTEGGQEGKTLVLTGPEALSMEAMTTKIAEAIGKIVKYVDAPAAQIGQGMAAGGVPQWLVDDLLQMYAGFKQGWGEPVTDTVATVTKHPPRKFDQFVRDFAAAFKG